MDLNPDQILIEKILHGEQLAFKELVEKYQTMIINTCNGFLHNKQDAEDTAQEVFIEVHTSLKKFRKESKLSTWIYRIAVNKSLNFIRGRKRRQWLKNIEDMLGIGGNAPGQISDNQNPASVMEFNESTSMLHKAIGTLPENQRIAFTLNKYEELSYAEVSEVMDVTLSSVESLIHRAKINLQKKLMNHYKNN